MHYGEGSSGVGRVYRLCKQAGQVPNLGAGEIEKRDAAPLLETGSRRCDIIGLTKETQALLTLIVGPTCMGLLCLYV